MKKLYLFVTLALITLSLNAQDVLSGWSFPVNTGTDSLNANVGLSGNQAYDLRFQWVTPNDTTINSIFFTDGSTHMLLLQPDGITDWTTNTGRPNSRPTGIPTLNCHPFNGAAIHHMLRVPANSRSNGDSAEEPLQMFPMVVFMLLMTGPPEKLRTFRFQLPAREAHQFISAGCQTVTWIIWEMPLRQTGSA
jgi:hypothetical protein